MESEKNPIVSVIGYELSTVSGASIRLKWENQKFFGLSAALLTKALRAAEARPARADR